MKQALNATGRGTNAAAMHRPNYFRRAALLVGGALVVGLAAYGAKEAPYVLAEGRLNAEKAKVVRMLAGEFPQLDAGDVRRMQGARILVVPVRKLEKEGEELLGNSEVAAISYDQGRGQYVMKFALQELDVGRPEHVVAHEEVHVGAGSEWSNDPLAKARGERLVPTYFYEGATEMMARQALADSGAETRAPVYGDALVLAALVEGMIGRQTFRQAYFEQDRALLAESFDAALGKGSFGKIVLDSKGAEDAMARLDAHLKGSGRSYVQVFGKGKEALLAEVESRYGL